LFQKWKVVGRLNVDATKAVAWDMEGNKVYYHCKIYGRLQTKICKHRKEEGDYSTRLIFAVP